MAYIHTKRFATYRTAITRGSGLTALFAILFLTIYSQVGWGQVTCPPGWIGPVGWSYTMWCGTGITVWFCDSLNTATNTDRRLIEQIDITSDSSGCTDDIAIIWSADSAVMDYPLGPPFCGTTSPGYLITSVMQASRWRSGMDLPFRKIDIALPDRKFRRVLCIHLSSVSKPWRRYHYHKLHHNNNWFSSLLCLTASRK